MTTGHSDASPVEAGPGLRLHLAYHGRYDVDPLRLLEPFPPTLELFAAAGTTGAAGRGQRLPLDGYGLWLRELERRSVVYANLLVPGDPEATWQHQQRLETWGLCPIPVVEVAPDHQVLGRYLEAGYRYIALSRPPDPRPTRWDLDAALPWLRRGFQLAGPGVGFHLLEATSWALVAALPWYSADVHGWTDALGREGLVWFNRGQGCFRQVAMAKSERWRILGFDDPDSVLRSSYERRAVLAGWPPRPGRRPKPGSATSSAPSPSLAVTRPGRGCIWIRWEAWSWPIAGSPTSPPRRPTSQPGPTATATPPEVSGIASGAT
jgi:hypothetical protein